MARFRIFVTYKKGIFDPPGATAGRALVSLGYDEVSSVKIGKFIQLEVEDGTPEARIAEMCERLLANPVIEEYRIEPAEEA